MAGFEARTQDWAGLITDNHAPVHAMHVQPASIANTPYSYYVNIAGAEFSAVNAKAFESLTNFFGGDPISYLENSDEFLIAVDGQLPSIVARLNERSSLGLEIKMRSIFFAESSNDGLLDLLRQDFKDPATYGASFEDQYVTGRSHLWWEINGTYARKLFQSGDHEIDGGITLKYINGAGSSYLNVDNFGFALNNGDTLAHASGVMQFVYNRELDELAESGKVSIFSNPSIASSFGLEYRFFAQNSHYKFKLGLALLDLGRISYTGSLNSGEYVANNQDIPLDKFRKAGSLAVLGDTLNNVLQKTSELPIREFDIDLPTRFAVQTEYHVTREYYVNFSAYLALKGSQRDFEKTKNFSSYVITPRYERAKWGLQIPISYNSLAGVMPGVSARFGPVYVGSENLLRGIFQSGNVQRLNVFLGFKWSRF